MFSRRTETRAHSHRCMYIDEKKNGYGPGAIYKFNETSDLTQKNIDK